MRFLTHVSLVSLGGTWALLVVAQLQGADLSSFPLVLPMCIGFFGVITALMTPEE